jgi:hypothetical protein
VRVLAYGDIMDGGSSAFTSVATVDGGTLKITFSGVIRVDLPYSHLESYVGELKRLLPKEQVDNVEFDFRELTFCNSNGFYVIMDVTEMVLNLFSCPVHVLRLSSDDWHQETLPILLNVDEPTVEKRMTITEHEEV